MLKKLFLVLLLIFLVVLGVAFYAWNRATSLPDWYDPEAVAVPLRESRGEDASPSAAPVDEAERTRLETLLRPAASEGRTPDRPTPDAPPESRSATEAPDVPEAPRAEQPEARHPAPAAGGAFPAARGGGPREVRLSERDFDTLVRLSLEEHRDGHRVRRATKVLRASIEGDRLKLGAITDVDRLMAAAENDKEREAIRKLTGALPWIEGRDVYVGIEGRPEARDGQLTFTGMTVEVGDVSFDPADLAGKLGVSSDQASRDVVLPLAGLDLEGVRIEGDEILLTVAGGSGSR